MLRLACQLAFLNDINSFITSPHPGRLCKGPCPMSSILSPSESLAFNGFLDHASGPEYDGLPDLASKIHIKQGRDALAKATMDLMVRGAPPSGSKSAPSSKAGSPSVGGAGTSSHWPSFSPEPAGAGATASKHASDHDARTLPSPFPTSTSSSSPASHQNRHSPYSYLSRAQSQNESQGHSSSHPQIPPIRSLTSANSSQYKLPPLADHLHTNSAHPLRPGTLSSSASAPSVLPEASSSTSSTSKRALTNATDLSIAPKRSRPSLSPTDDAAPPSASNPKPRRQTIATPSNKRPPPPPSKPALLSPSQKRANHIQSEQKRRANIRRGYETLCVAVPALREAIAAEDLGATAESGGRGPNGNEKGKKRRRKTEEEKGDGRAGPRSESVVLQKSECVLLLILQASHGRKMGWRDTSWLQCFSQPRLSCVTEFHVLFAGYRAGQIPSVLLFGRLFVISSKTCVPKPGELNVLSDLLTLTRCRHTAIDYIKSLLTDRNALLARLHFARSSLGRTHPALPVPDAHKDGRGVPLWEYEWTGGTGVADDGDDGEGADGDVGDDGEGEGEGDEDEDDR
ncbi:hypothetical protein AcV7_006593 [Taiwanofungus camphoratus]|nr:hypothetical protein AcV7_006593 [Antrodia cinnamomea]